VPVTCAGMQGHFSTPTAPERMLQVLDRFAQLGLRLRITEYDINTADEQLQADFTRDILTVAFSHPAVDQFLMWGFWEGRHWRPDAAMYRRDWTEKPNGAIWRKMLFEEWWTDDSGEANGEGRFTTRGFTGDYAVEVSLGDRRASVEAKLSARGETVVIPLP
jgi:endo-1,4-beta-xylanase